MSNIPCRNCGATMQMRVHAEHVTAACPCGARIAAPYVFRWSQVPTQLRAQATKNFGINGKWRILPLTALQHALGTCGAPAGAQGGR